MSITRNNSDGFAGLFKTPADPLATPYLNSAGIYHYMIVSERVVTDRRDNNQSTALVSINNINIITGSLTQLVLQYKIAASPAYIQLEAPCDTPITASSTIRIVSGSNSSEEYTFSTAIEPTERVVHVPFNSTELNGAQKNYIALRNLCSLVNDGTQTIYSNDGSHSQYSDELFKSEYINAYLDDTNTVRFTSKIAGTSSSLKMQLSTDGVWYVDSSVYAFLNDWHIFKGGTSEQSTWNELGSVDVSDLGSELTAQIPGIIPAKYPGINYNFRAYFKNGADKIARWNKNTLIGQGSLTITRRIDDNAYLYMYNQGDLLDSVVFNGVSDMSEYAEVSNLICENATVQEGDDFGDSTLNTSDSIVRLAWKNPSGLAFNPVDNVSNSFVGLGRSINTEDGISGSPTFETVYYYNYDPLTGKGEYILVSNVTIGDSTSGYTKITPYQIRSREYNVPQQAFVKIKEDAANADKDYVVFRFDRGSVQGNPPTSQWPAPDEPRWKYIGKTSITSMNVPCTPGHYVAFWVGFGTPGTINTTKMSIVR